MHAFVDTMLRRMSGARNDADIAAMLGYLAGELGYRSAFMLDFPDNLSDPIQLWDSNEKRAAWWREQTGNGKNSISRSLSEALSAGGVQYVRIEPSDPRYTVAVEHDFFSATVVPITFAHEIRGIASFSGECVHVGDMGMSLEIVCYGLLMQARLIRARRSEQDGVSLTPREREVMQLSARGLTSGMIAAELGLSARTVNQHVDNTAGKLQTRNRVHTVAEAIRRGLLS